MSSVIGTVSNSLQNQTWDSSHMTDRLLLNRFVEKGIRNIVSVPCSITDTWQSLANSYSKSGVIDLVMSNHEGNLAGIAAGIYFGTGKPALIHMQNSGLFNAADGFVSFANKSMYGIPMVVLVTFRGATTEDNSEPHQEIGKRTDDLVNLVFDPTTSVVGGRDCSIPVKDLDKSVQAALEGNISVIKLPSSAFSKTTSLSVNENPKHVSIDEYEKHNFTKGDASKSKRFRLNTPISRDAAILSIIEEHPNAAILFSNGYNSRAAQAIADRPGNFYSVGYMGGTLAIGWGLARSNKNLEVVVVDGDQNAQMSSMKDHLSSEYPENLNWYILDNHIGASVGTSESVPLSPLYKHLAKVVTTYPDQPYSFCHPRVRGICEENQDSLYTLGKITQTFRNWISERG